MAEVDEQALPENVKLLDCLPDINTHMNGIIKSGRDAGYTGDDLVDHVYEHLGHASQIDAEIETWIKAKLPKAGPGNPGKIFEPKYNTTKYQGVSTGKLAPIICCSGVIMGGDKIGHFFQLGYRIYYRKKGINPLYGREMFEDWAIKSRKNYENYDWDDIVKDAGVGIGNYGRRKLGYSKPPQFVQADWNRRKEMGNFGLKASGVFSPADIAANDAGAVFYSNLSKLQGGGMNIGTFIDKSWSETTNPGKYTGVAGPKVWKNLLLHRNWSIEMKKKDGTVLMKGLCKFTPNGSRFKAAVTGFGQSSPTLDQLMIEFQKDKFNMVSGIIMDGNWSLGAQSGTLMVKSDSENKLKGAWAFGDPIIPDGFCTITC